MAQAVALLVLALVTAGLFVAPDRTLPLFWNLIVPVVPLLLVAQPILWRNICPLATLNQWTGRRGGGRSLGTGLIGSGALTVATFALVLPLRPLVLDAHGWATGALLGASAIGALVAGIFVKDRGGFCHLVCPVLPAERLYGVGPVIPIPPARCEECSVCTPRGCPELAGEKAFRQVLGPGRKSTAWIRSVWGFGFLAFPGIVVAFFTLPEAWGSSPFLVYGWIWGLAALSWGLFAAITVAARLPARKAVAVAAAVALGTYYWHAVPRILATLTAPEVLTVPLRLAFLSVALLWCAREMFRDEGVQPAVGVR